MDEEDIKIMIEDKVEKSLTTQELVNKHIRENNKFLDIELIHYPYTEGIMADQLNFAIDELNKNNLKNKETTYFAVYNADSLPDLNTIQEFYNTIVSNNYPLVMQQYSYSYSNWDDLSNIMKGFALYQTNFELKYGLINASVPKKYLYSYVVGHGMVYRFDKLIELGGFTVKFWCEDIYMSCLLKAKKIPIIPIYSLEKMEAPSKINILIRQNAVWFRTAFECISIYKHIKKVHHVSSIDAMFWVLQRIRMNLSWLLTPILLTFTFIFPIFKQDYRLMIYSIIIYCFMIVGVYIIPIRMIEKLTDKEISKKIKLLFFSAFSVLISNYGPMYSLLNLKTKEKYKTIR